MKKNIRDMTTDELSSAITNTECILRENDNASNWGDMVAHLKHLIDEDERRQPHHGGCGCRECYPGIYED